MKLNVISSAVLASLLMVGSLDAGAASFGRSSSSSSRPSISRSTPTPTKSVAPTSPSQNKVGGIGGTSGSMGVRKPDVTQRAVNPTTPQQQQSQSYSRPVTPSPNYNNQPSGVTNGSTFVSSLGGAVVGTAIGSMLFGNHSNGGGTTVINNGAPVAGGASSAVPGVVADQGGVVPMVGYQQQPTYGIWGFIKDVLGFGVLIALIGGIGFMVYKLIKKWKNKLNVASGFTKVDPVAPMEQFWKIQRAFADADTTALNQLIGPAMIDEVTGITERTVLSITQASYNVLLNNAREFSVHYTFSDEGIRINQVWHYELINGSWKLNGLENI